VGVSGRSVWRECPAEVSGGRVLRECLAGVSTGSVWRECLAGVSGPSTKLRGCFDFREMWVEELRQKGDFKTELFSDSSNLADIFTKCLSNVDFVVRRQQIVEFQQSRVYETQ
jgi:hypothetical protein